jgi:hypothetical protein
MDLVDLSAISRYNKNFKYLLVAINVFSRKLFIEPLKTKTGGELVQAIARVYQKSPITRYCQSDFGGEFYNAKVKDYFKTNNMTHFSTSNYDTKASLVERANKTIKGRMWRYFTQNSTLTYLPILQSLVDAYNNRVHSSLGITPNQVNESNESKVWLHLYKDYLLAKREPFTFKIGDIVRISKLQRTFKKGYLTQFNEEFFKVIDCIPTNPPVYKLQDNSGEILGGNFYRQEITKVVPRRDFKILKSRTRKGKREHLIHITGHHPDSDKWLSTREFKNLQTNDG